MIWSGYICKNVFMKTATNFLLLTSFVVHADTNSLNKTFAKCTVAGGKLYRLDEDIQDLLRQSNNLHLIVEKYDVKVGNIKEEIEINKNLREIKTKRYSNSDDSDKRNKLIGEIWRLDDELKRLNNELTKTLKAKAPFYSDYVEVGLNLFDISEQSDNLRAWLNQNCTIEWKPNAIDLCTESNNYFCRYLHNQKN